ncbi:hypothetical protein AL479_23660 [Citrobacter amalonaticus]|nr:hypothetical protein AL479_23660 [Citrobacter amalonaticus]
MIIMAGWYVFKCKGSAKSCKDRGALPDGAALIRPTARHRFVGRIRRSRHPAPRNHATAFSSSCCIN